MVSTGLWDIATGVAWNGLHWSEGCSYWGGLEWLLGSAVQYIY